MAIEVVQRLCMNDVFTLKREFSRFHLCFTWHEMSAVEIIE